jgi:hypothetical protein
LEAWFCICNYTIQHKRKSDFPFNWVKHKRNKETEHHRMV